MDEFNHENNLINVSSATAKESRKKIGRYTLFIAMASACLVAPAAFLIYFIVKSDTVGIWSFAVSVVIAAGVLAAVFAVVIPRLKSAQSTVKNFVASGGEMKKTPPLDAFCITTVKIMFTCMAALLICAVPTLITVCFGMTAEQIFSYIGGCLGAFWGMNTAQNDFFSYIVGLGLMAVIFGLLLLIIKFVNKLLK